MASAGGVEPEAGKDCVVCDMCEAGETATSHCDDCLMNLCGRCVADHHRFSLRGRHSVQDGVADFRTEIELCPVDGQKMSFFCRTCSVRVCPECEMGTKAHVMHSVMPLDRYVGQEKERLLDRLDDVTSKTETISYFTEDIKHTALSIELKWLERKEQIRQEFTSLFELITLRQQQLLGAMDDEVNKSLENLKALQGDQQDVVFDACQLSDECITAVQHLSRENFMKNYPQFLDSFHQLEQRVCSMTSPEDHMPKFLSLPFSLYKEKLHLSRCLAFPAFDCLTLRPKEHSKFVPYQHLREKVRLKTLVGSPVISDLPPSSLMRYQVEVYRGSSKTQSPAWRSREWLKGTDMVFNGDDSGVMLEAGGLYTVTVTPILLTTMHTGSETRQGRTITILIVTEQAPITPGLNIPKAVERRSLQVASGCGDVFSTSSSDHNNNNNTCSRLQYGEMKSVFPPVHTCPCFPANRPHRLVPAVSARELYDAPLPKYPAQCPCSEGDQGFARLQCSNWYRELLSFEEARLLEDRHLKLFTLRSYPGL